jgi:hypothetical protein
MNPSARPKGRRMFPRMTAVPSGLQSILLSPELQMQDLIDRLNDAEPIPTTPVTTSTVGPRSTTKLPSSTNA